MPTVLDQTSMNPAGTNGWNYPRMLVLGIFLFLCHLAVLRWWVRESASPPELTAVVPSGRWVESGLSGLGISAIHPRIFGLDGDSGFSAAARQILPHTVPESSERKVSVPPGLSATAQRLGQVPPGPVFIKRGIPEPAVALLDVVKVPVTPSPSGTVVERGGGLSSRVWKKPPIFAPWAGTEVPRPVLLRVAVTPSGYIMLASVGESSGFPDADRLAVAAVRKARFQPEVDAVKNLPGSEQRLVWGSIQVRWSIGTPLSVVR